MGTRSLASSARVTSCTLLLLLATGCGERSAPVAANEPNPASPSEDPTGGTFGSIAMLLPCDESDQTYGALDIPDPGQPSPAEAVAPFADGLTLVSEGGARHARVHALRLDGTVVRIFDVTKREDGWWPDRYGECSEVAAP
jgi:hypothetical protein